MPKHANNFIFLLGDLATLDALFTFASWAHSNIHQKPILLNDNNFYDAFIEFINHAIKNHFVYSQKNSLFVLLLLMSYSIF